MITDKFKRIEYKYGDIIKIKPIFDVHLGASVCDEQAFKRYLGDSDEKTYFIGGGDLLDSIICSDLKRYTKSNDSTSGDDIIDEQLDRMYALLEPYKEKILGLGEGNHESKITKSHGTNPIKRLAKMLNTPFLSYTWMYRLVLAENKARVRTVVIRGHHGWGGGARTIGADLTKFSRDTAYYDADIFLYGHVHKRQYDEVPRLSLAGGKLIARPKIIVLCGTFLKTLSPDENSTYSEIAGYPPISIGGATISIRPDSKFVSISVSV